MRGDRSVASRHHRSVAGLSLLEESGPIPPATFLAVALLFLVAALFFGDLIRWFAVLASLLFLLLFFFAIVLRKAGIRQKDTPIPEDAIRKKNYIESTLSQVARAREGSNYSQMVVRARIRSAIVKRKAAKHSLSVAEVDSAIEEGRTEGFAWPAVLARLLREAELDRVHWTDRAVQKGRMKGGVYDSQFNDALEAAEAI